MYNPGRISEFIQLDAGTLEPWRKHLLDAADLIDKHGLAKGVLESSEGFCVHGALYKAMYGYSCPVGVPTLQAGTSPEITHLRDHLLRKGYGPSDGITVYSEHVCMWNNMATRTKEEVVNNMRACALQ